MDPILMLMALGCATTALSQAAAMLAAPSLSSNPLAWSSIGACLAAASLVAGWRQE
jgi:hypothetical protein